ncbi:MAG: dihydrofolate reductase [Hyphomicrobium sp.]
MILSLIVAVADNGVIGRAGRLPWRMPSDLKTFRRLTLGKPIVMGRKTFQSIGKALDGRDNIVVTRDPSFVAAGVSTVDSLTDALTLARGLARTKGVDEVMVIGGAEVFTAALPRADRIYWTEIHGSPAGDVTFARPPAEGWREVSREAIARGEKDEFAATLTIFERR